STLSCVMDAFAIVVSIGLQYGVPLETFVSKFINMRFEPSGITKDADIRFASSLVDYVFRRLALEYLPPEKREGLGVQSIDERKEYANGVVAGTHSPESEPQQPQLIDLSTEKPGAKPDAIAGRGGAWFQGDGVELHLGVEQDFRPAPKAHPAFVVTGLDELRARLEEAGVEFEEQPQLEGFRRFHAFDPFGNRLEF